MCIRSTSYLVYYTEYFVSYPYDMYCTEYDTQRDIVTITAVTGYTAVSYIYIRTCIPGVVHLPMVKVSKLLVLLFFRVCSLKEAVWQQ